MENMPLAHVSFNQLSDKFIGLIVDWTIQVDSIYKINNSKYKIFFISSEYSRMESFTVNPMDFVLVNFIKKNDRCRIKAKIKTIDRVSIELDQVEIFEKLK
ncbi:MAG: hypothetical protein ACXWEW_09805 [Nitrososphaeraceae archaeon]